MAGSSSSAGTRPGRSRSSSTRTPALSDLDRRILDYLSFLRVLTQTQLASLLSPEIPPRTLRYQTARLAKLGLIGRTRPYRERIGAASSVADAEGRGDRRGRTVAARVVHDDGCLRTAPAAGGSAHGANFDRLVRRAKKHLAGVAAPA